MSLGFVKDELGDVKQGIRPLRLFHRLNHPGEALVFRLERDLNRQSGWG